MQPSKELLIKGLKTTIITPGDNLLRVLETALKSCKLQEKDVLVVSSKVVAVTQGRIKRIKSPAEFDKLVKSEADKVFEGGPVTLTVKTGIFIPWAGIDRSNAGKGTAILWPRQPFKTAEEIRSALKKRYKLKNLGIIISDSHCVPLRKGVTGIAIGYAGFKGVKDLRGRKDLFGNRLKVTQQNLADMMASAAHLVMGEADEKTPFALIRNAPVDFTASKPNPAEPLMEKEKCLFAPLY